jgi:hypothetical protein
MWFTVWIVVVTFLTLHFVSAILVDLFFNISYAMFVNTICV